MTSSPRILREVLLVWLVTLVVIRVIVTVADAGAPEWLKAAVPLLFMYVPVWWMLSLIHI